MPPYLWNELLCKHSCHHLRFLTKESICLSSFGEVIADYQYVLIALMSTAILSRGVAWVHLHSSPWFLQRSTPRSTGITVLTPSLNILCATIPLETLLNHCCRFLHPQMARGWAVVEFTQKFFPVPSFGLLSSVKHSFLQHHAVSLCPITPCIGLLT